jgi:hypothetical protein
MINFRIWKWPLCVGIVAVGVSGCADSRAKRYGVSGEVTWQGKPLDRGGITFLPADASVGSSGGAIIGEGRYAIPAQNGLLPGRYRVMITSADPSNRAPDPNVPPGPSGPLPRDRIKPKYNAQSILSAEVKTDGSNTFSFEVD